MKLLKLVTWAVLGSFVSSCSSKPVEFYSTRRQLPPGAQRPVKPPSPMRPNGPVGTGATTAATSANSAATTETVEIGSAPQYSSATPYGLTLPVPVPKSLPDSSDALELLKQPTTAPKVAENIILNRLSLSQLETVARDQPLAQYRPFILWRMGQINQKARRPAPALECFRALVSQYPQHPLSVQANTMITLLQATQQVDPSVIGAILPLTGRNASVGQHALNALKIGFGTEQPGAKFKLALYDTQSLPDSVTAGVDRLLIDNKAIAIVGGLSSREATLIAQRADQLSIPFIALSQKPGLTGIGDFVFRNSLTPEMQVDQLVDFAFQKLSAKRFAILYPNDSYGVEFANIFWDQVLARGGQVNAVQTYDSKENDFTGIIQKMVGTYYPEGRPEEYKQRIAEMKKIKKDRALKNKKDNKPAVARNTREHEVEEAVLQPIVDFDVLFIPDSGKTLGQVMAFVKANDVPNLTYLGTNIWNSPDIVKRASGQKENIYFVDALDPNDAAVRSTEFFKDYMQQFNEEPTLIDMQAFESAKILRDLIGSGSLSRDSLAARLRILGRTQGVTGELRMSTQREIERPVHVLSLDNGLIKRIN